MIEHMKSNFLRFVKYKQQKQYIVMSESMQIKKTSASVSHGCCDVGGSPRAKTLKAGWMPATWTRFSFLVP